MGVGATPFDPSEAEGLIPAVSTQEQLNEHELLNITSALEWLDRYGEVREQILTVAMLKELHRRMFDRTWRWAGHFRTTQKNLGVEAYRIESELVNLLADVEVWLAGSVYPDREIAARFHHRLVLIHAFPNGNGRHARIATEVLCESRGGELPTWGVTCAPRSREHYLEALRSADGHNIAPLVAFMWS